MNKVTNNLVIENARIMFRNFQGKESKFNMKGRRNFCVVIDDPKQAAQLSSDGWNVKQLRPRDDYEEPTYYIQVAVNYGWNPPKVYLINRKAKVILTEETIGMLDQAEIHNVDLTIRPYNWEVNGESGVKGYLRSMYVTLEEDEFAAKYAEEEYPGEENDDELPF